LLGAANLGLSVAARAARGRLEITGETGIAAVGIGATGARLRQVDAGELIVDNAAIEPTFTDASIWSACARFETHVACVRKAAFLALATPLKTETVDTGGATDTGDFGRTGVRAEVLVDANGARSGIAASPAIAAVGKGTAFAGDADARSGLFGATDLRFDIATRTADIGLQIADLTGILAVSICAASALDVDHNALVVVGAPVAAGGEGAPLVDAAEIRAFAAAGTVGGGIIRAAEGTVAPADGVAAAIERAARLIEPTAFGAVDGR
jgi:hypothetical protein